MTASLSPYGVTTQDAKNRLDNLPRGEDNPERIIMHMWEEANISNPGTNKGLVPLIIIAHRCNEGCRGNDHAYRPIPRRDIELVAATVQYLACHVGHHFLTRFLKEIGYEVAYNHTRFEERSAARKTKTAPPKPIEPEVRQLSLLEPRT